MTTAPHIWLFYNSASGSHDDVRIGAICERLKIHGKVRRTDCNADGMPTIDQLDRAGANLLVIHGGDGTLSGALQKLDGWGGKVLPLPGGTSNLLCHRLFVNCETDAILDQLEASTLVPRRLACVQWRGGISIAEILVGPGALWANVREDIRDRDVGSAVAEAVDVISRSANGPLAVMARPAIGDREGYGAIRLVAQTGGLSVDGYNIHSITDFLAQGAAIALRDYRQGPHEELGEHDQVVCQSTGNEPLGFMVDGEIVEGQAEERFSLATLALDLLGDAND